MSFIKRIMFLAVLASLPGGPLIHASEFEVLDKFSVDGNSLFRGSVDVLSNSFTVDGSTFVVKDGKVGIGTADPVYPLHVLKDSAVAGVFERASGNTQVSVVSAGGSIISSWGVLGTGESFIGANSNNDFLFRTTGTEKMRITSAGAVGIGTTGPAAKLHVYDTNISNPATMRITTPSGSEVVISTSGNVGIGTTSPGASLEVAGEIKVGYSASACASAAAGTLRWYDGHISVCNGLNWRQLDNQPPPVITSVTPESGLFSGGTAITVIGTGFSSGLELSIGGVSANTIALTGATQITAVTPAGTAGARELKVTNPDGQYVTGVFIYNPLPTITNISPASGPAGTAITITGTGFAAGAGVTVGTNAATVTGVTAIQIIATTPANSTSGAKDVRVTNIDTGSVTQTGGFAYSVYATGGTFTETSGYRIHTFTAATSPKTFALVTGGNNIEVLAVAGGGGGGGMSACGSYHGAGGGGGGGGVVYETKNLSAGDYSIVVGAGGTGASAAVGTNGGNSSALGAAVAVGGGGGARGCDGINGQNGGSGGGGSREANVYGTATSGQGYNGGSATADGNGGGGGGGGGAGYNGDNARGQGGAGYGSAITGSLTYYAGGGGGGEGGNKPAVGASLGGSGGGGAGGAVDVNPGSGGSANTGGGGGGGAAHRTVSTPSSGGNGGSGIVIIRYPK